MLFANTERIDGIVDETFVSINYILILVLFQYIIVFFFSFCEDNIAPSTDIDEQHGEQLLSLPTPSNATGTF